MPMSPRLLRPRASGRNRFRSLRVGLVAYWPMNETADSGDVTAEDWTGRGNNLTSNNTVPSAAGIQGNARSFTAANSEWLAAASNNVDLRFADGRDWTFAGWILVPTWTVGTIFAGNDSSGNREFIADLRFNADAALQNRLAFQINPGGAAGGSVIVGALLAVNTWHFFAFTYTHSTGVIAGRTNNGQGSNFATATRTAGSLVQSTQPFNLGRRQFTSANSYFGGRLDEVAKWDRVLTTDELDTLWNNGTGIDLRQ